jgi:hypothetical protein
MPPMGGREGFVEAAIGVFVAGAVVPCFVCSVACEVADPLMLPAKKPAIKITWMPGIEAVGQLLVL